MQRYSVTLRSLMIAVAFLPLVAPPDAQAQSPDDFVPVTDAMLQAPAPGDWPMWRRTLDGWGYSPLDQIDRDNAGELRMVWSRSLTPGSQQGTPLVYDGVMYMPNPGDVIQAIDAVTSDLRWEYRRTLPDDLADHVLASVMAVNRNLAIYGNLIIDTSADDYVFALDAGLGPPGLGNRDPRLQDEPGSPNLRPDHRQRQSDLGTRLHAARRSGGLRHHRP